MGEHSSLHTHAFLVLSRSKIPKPKKLKKKKKRQALTNVCVALVWGWNCHLWLAAGSALSERWPWWVSCSLACSLHTLGHLFDHETLNSWRYTHDLHSTSTSHAIISWLAAFMNKTACLTMKHWTIDVTHITSILCLHVLILWLAAFSDSHTGPPSIFTLKQWTAGVPDITGIVYQVHKMARTSQKVTPVTQCHTMKVHFPLYKTLCLPLPLHISNMILFFHLYKLMRSLSVFHFS